MSGSEQNRRSYDAVAAQWATARAGFFGREQAYLDLLLSDLSEGALVLDLGCGTGRPMADYVLARGFRLIGVDQSTALLAVARERHPDVQWTEARIEDYRPPEPASAVLLWDSLFHIERDRHEAILWNAVDTLVPGGRLMFTAGGSAHPAFTDTMFGETFFYDSLSPDETRALLERLGLKVLLFEFMNEPDGGRNKGRIAVVAEK